MASARGVATAVSTTTPDRGITTVTVDDMLRDVRRYLRQVRSGERLLLVDTDGPVAQLTPQEGGVLFCEVPATPKAGQTRATTAASPRPLEEQIDQLYEELEQLLPRATADPATRRQLEEKRQRLRTLQQQEAEIMEHRASARLHFDPAAGQRLIERAAQLLER